MRKLIFSILFVVLLLGFVALVSADENSTLNETQGNGNKSVNKSNMGIGQALSREIKQKRMEFREGNFTGPQGQFLQVREIVAGLKEIRVDNVQVETELNITKETEDDNETSLKVQLSNGRNAQIKIMPDTASERALERLRLKVCNAENNCTIELKETGNATNKKVTYEIQVQRHYRLLGLFSTKAENKAEVDAETGEVTITKKPWWAFIAVSE